MMHVGDYVKTPHSDQHGIGRVLQLADYRKVANGNGLTISAPHGAVVIYPNHAGGLYPFEMLEWVEPPEKPKDQPQQEVKPAAEQQLVWRWCAVCFDRTDHKPSGAMLMCIVCGHRVKNTAPDCASSYTIPTEDDENIAKMAGSQMVAAG